MTGTSHARGSDAWSRRPNAEASRSVRSRSSGIDGGTAARRRAMTPQPPRTPRQRHRQPARRRARPARRRRGRPPPRSCCAPTAGTRRSGHRCWHRHRTGLPIRRESPMRSSRSSTCWKAMPKCRPNLPSALTTSGVGTRRESADLGARPEQLSRLQRRILRVRLDRGRLGQAALAQLTGRHALERTRPDRRGGRGRLGGRGGPTGQQQVADDDRRRDTRARHHRRPPAADARRRR